MNDEKIMTVYFTSGNCHKFYISDDEIIVLLNQLKNNWDKSICYSLKHGINFSLVTHYTIEDATP